MTLAPDLRLGDRYTLLGRIAVGGMGEVWRAQDTVLGRAVAVKVLKPEYASDAAFLERFRREAQHTAALSHPGIAGVYDYGEVGGSAYLVMELVPGRPLSTLLAEEGPLPAGQALDIVGQAAFALQAAHDAGIVHRDVKPGNLIVRPDGVVKVTDFGIAHAADSSALTTAGMVVGTAHYLSPEQGSGDPITAASDVYSLGVVLYECLAGARPFQADSPVAVALAHMRDAPPPLPETVPAPARSLVERTLAKDPAQRPSPAGRFGREALALAARLRDTSGVHGLPALAAADLAAAGVAAADLAGAASGGTRLLPVGSADPTTALGGPVGTAGPISAAAREAQRRRVRATFTAIALAAVLLGTLLLYLLTRPGIGTVPPLVGLPIATAQQRLHAAGFPTQLRQVHDAAHPAGTVLNQDPSTGTRFEKGKPVLLTVASGPLVRTVDPALYVGQPFTQVAASLEALGLHVAEAMSPPGGAAPDTVLSVTPSGPVLEGSTVTVTVAATPPPKPGHGKGHPGGGGGGD